MDIILFTSNDFRYVLKQKVKGYKKVNEEITFALNKMESQ